ncbi:MAG: glycosyltransferase family 39 protein [Terracidiphilus sp.]|jgi:4-amino-4-deoxy-L-arabinose transferase-like glycosyltransferase
MSTSPGYTAEAGQKGSSRWLLPVIILAAFAIRLVLVCFTYRDLPDADKFYEQFGWEMGWIARALASGHGFSSPYYPWSGPTAIEPPLYPALLSVVFRLFGIYTLTAGFVMLSINSLLSALTCIPVYFSAKYSLGARGARWAAWTWAFYPFAIYFSAGRVWEYSLTGLLFTTCFCIAQRIHKAEKPLLWLGWGALFGVTILSNPTTLSTLPFLLLLALWKVRRSGERWLLKGTLTTIAVIAVLTPWTVRNYRALGVICPVRDNIWMEIYADNFGNALWDQSSPPSADLRPYPASDAREMKKYLAMGETAYLADKHALSIDDFKHRPHFGFLISKTLRRFFYYWSGYWSFSSAELQAQPFEPENMFYVCGMTLLMLRGIRRFWRRNREAVLPYLVLVCIFPLTYYLTNPLMDYRQAIEPAIVVLAISGLLPLGRIHSRRLIQWVGAERALDPEFAATPPLA